MWRGIFRDIRYSLRIFRRNPSLAVVAIGTLGIGIGAITIIFGLLNALIVRELPVRDPGRLVAIHEIDRSGTEDGILVSMVKNVKLYQRVFTGLFGYSGDSVYTTETNGALASTDVAFVTEDYYSVLGVKPLMGSLIGPETVTWPASTTTQIAVLSYNFWEQRYGGDPGVVGQTIRIEGIPFTIIGVSPRNFSGLDIAVPTDVTVPVGASPLINARLVASSIAEPLKVDYIVAKLRRGITIRQANEQLKSIWSAALAASVSGSLRGQEQRRVASETFEIEGASTGFSYLRARFSESLYALMAIGGLLLFVGCANLAGLLLARSTATTHEMAVRIALGARRFEIARQLLTQSLILAIAGGTVGILLAIFGSQTLANFMLRNIYSVPAHLDVRLGLPSIGFAVSVAILTAVLFGLLPAFQATRACPKNAMSQNPRSVGKGSSKLGRALIVAQVALSMVLLLCTGMFVQSLERLAVIDSGFHARSVLLAFLAPQPGAYEKSNQADYYRGLTERLQRLPSVESVSLSHMAPIGNFESQENVGPASVPNGREIEASFGVISPHFFKALGVTLIEGRDFTWEDRDKALRVCVLTEALARHMFPGQLAIGQHIRIGSEPTRQNIEVVGVVSNLVLYDIRAKNTSVVFVPFLQEPEFSRYPVYEIRTAGSPKLVESAVRRVIESFGREYPSRMRTLQDQIDMSLLEERIVAGISSFFGVIVLLLASIGLYGLLSYSVARRTREIGIRMALGAQKRNILGMVLRESVGLVLVGVAIGLPCAIASLRFMEHLIFGLSRNDPLVIAEVVGVLLCVAVLAGILPARHAANLAPAAALHFE